MNQTSLQSRRVPVSDSFDAIQDYYEEQGWTDGLPVVPATEELVRKMLAGYGGDPATSLGVIQPRNAQVTLEKVAVNAVMAGCRPEYLPVVIAAVEAVCTDEFNIHGVLATTMGVGPIVVVNGPIRRAIGMNTGINVFGQGNRANSTIGRALQLVVRNVGGGRPGEVDRATYGNPGKLGFCFAEDEEGSPFEPFSTRFGSEAGVDAVTVFAGEGPRNVVDQLSRDPDSLACSLAACLRTVHHPKMLLGFDAMLAMGPEHSRIFRAAGWSRDEVVARLIELTQVRGAEVMRGADGIAEGLPLPSSAKDAPIPKFKDGGLLLVHCGGGAGLFSAIIGGWANGDTGSQPVAREIVR